MMRVLHLVGSAFNDFYCDLSRFYAQDCLDATADATQYEFHIAYVTPDRLWRFPKSLERDAIAAAEILTISEAVQVLIELKIDVMLPQMFCIAGMTSYRALFDLLSIPYVGNTPDLMALAANKARTKAIVSAAGVNVPEGEILRIGNFPKIATPAVVKPINADNSQGLGLVKNPSEYDKALKTAFSFSDEILVERYIELGREVRCGIVVEKGKLICLPLEEYALDENQPSIRRYEDKLKLDSDGELEAVAKGNEKSWIVDPSDPITARVWEAARTCHIALGCRHYSLFDFRIDASDRPWFLEAGLYCSFAKKSVISEMARASGIPLKRLFQNAINNALGI